MSAPSPSKVSSSPPSELVQLGLCSGPPKRAPFASIRPAKSWATIAAKPAVCTSQPWSGRLIDISSCNGLTPLRPVGPRPSRTSNIRGKPIPHSKTNTKKSRYEHHVLHDLEKEFNSFHELVGNISSSDFDDFQLPKSPSRKHQVVSLKPRTEDPSLPGPSIPLLVRLLITCSRGYSPLLPKVLVFTTLYFAASSAKKVAFPQRRPLNIPFSGCTVNQCAKHRSRRPRLLLRRNILKPLLLRLFTLHRQSRDKMHVSPFPSPSMGNYRVQRVAVRLPTCEFECDICHLKILSKPREHPCFVDSNLIVIDVEQILQCSSSFSSALRLQNHLNAHKKAEALSQLPALTIPPSRRRKRAKKARPTASSASDEDNTHISEVSQVLAPPADGNVKSSAVA
ncbi:hypothetical protein CDAR_288621 [Caerostris darwini]|uniref:C2H2-type domain-containing protein n=1 Tax=Caerostris darwini TaxID=1538125 RepID=A0AAV4RLX9_9ARAC|nr:hypothetical protein CDAR_288621 [Caerostris darwini]